MQNKMIKKLIWENWVSTDNEKDFELKVIKLSDQYPIVIAGIQTTSFCGSGKDSFRSF